MLTSMGCSGTWMIWIVIAPVSSVIPMHEQMQQRAGRQQQERQKAKEMGPVFGKEEKGGDGEKAN